MPFVEVGSQRYHCDVRTIFLSLGSNLGDRKVNIRRALKLLAPSVKVEKKSPVYETEPMYVGDQPKFYNMVVRGKTELSPEELLAYTQGVEAKMGRDPNTHNRPRIIDIDILFYDDRIVALPNLSIPHPKISERAFVLVPLNDIAPRLRHPALDLTTSELLKKFPDWRRDVCSTSVRV